MATMYDNMTAELSWSQWSYSPVVATPEQDAISKHHISFAITNAVEELCFGRRLRQNDDVTTPRSDDDVTTIDLGEVSAITPEVSTGSSRWRRRSNDFRFPLSSTMKDVSRNLMEDLMEEDLVEDDESHADLPAPPSSIDSGYGTGCLTSVSDSSLQLRQRMPADGEESHSTPQRSSAASRRSSIPNAGNNISVADSDATVFYRKPLCRRPVTCREETSQKVVKIGEKERRRSIAKSLKRVGRMLLHKSSTGSSSCGLETLAVL